MQTRSDLWIKLASRGTFTMESVAVVGGVEYTTISAPRINRTLFSENLSVGNCNSATLDLSILTGNIIPESAEIVIKARLTDGVEYSEWKEFGTFYIDNRSWDDGLTTTLCYDAMRKAEQQFIDPLEPTEEMNWPRSMVSCVEEIAARIGVELDPRTVINTSEPYQVLYPDRLSMLEILGFIGACHGGNWIITPKNRLRLVPLVSTPETYYILDHAYNRISPSDGFLLVSQYMDTSDDVRNPAGGGAVNVPVVINKIATSNHFTITRVTLAIDEDTGWTIGDDTGYELRIDGNPYACRAICEDLYTKYAGLIYQPFDIQNACYDPAAELGDWLVAGSDVHSVLCSEYVTMDADFRSDACAPAKEEVGSEYPFLTEIQKLNRQDERLKKYMEQSEAEFHSRIEQTRSQILLEVAATYATSDALEEATERLATEFDLVLTEYATKADLTITSESITSSVSQQISAESAARQEDVSGLENSIGDLSDELDSRIESVNATLSSQIEQTESSITAQVTQEITTVYQNIDAESIARQEDVSGLQNDIGDLSDELDITNSNVGALHTTTQELSSSITLNSQQIALKVSKGDVSSQISVETGDVTIRSNRLTIESTNFSLSKEGEVSASGTFRTSGTQSPYVGIFGAELDGGGLRFFYDEEEKSEIQNYGYGLLISTDDTIIMSTGSTADRRVILNSGATNVLGYYESIVIENTSRFMNDIHSQGRIYFGWYTQWDDILNICAGYGINNSGYGLLVYGDLEVYGGIACSGTKYRVVSTDNYGKVGMNAMESANAVFSDMGSVILDENGVAEVFLDPVFAETVDLLHDYHVFTSSGEASRVEKCDGFFTVYGAPGANIDWIIFYRQNTYTTDRMENVLMDESKDETENDMSVFCGDNDAAANSEKLMNSIEDNYEAQAKAYLTNYEKEILGDEYY